MTREMTSKIPSYKDFSGLFYRQYRDTDPNIRPDMIHGARGITVMADKRDKDATMQFFGELRDALNCLFMKSIPGDPGSVTVAERSRLRGREEIMRLIKEHLFTTEDFDTLMPILLSGNLGDLFNGNAVVSDSSLTLHVDADAPYNASEKGVSETLAKLIAAVLGCAIRRYRHQIQAVIIAKPATATVHPMRPLTP